MDQEQMKGMDPYMLLSWFNMKLRDEGEKLINLCNIYDLDVEELVSKLHTIGYRYEEKTNQFISSAVKKE